MTPKEKAVELVDNYVMLVGSDWNGLAKARKCAIIAVDEIIKASPRYQPNVDWNDVGATHQYYYEAKIEKAEKFWQQVKEEIQLL